jgi:hypothetical protein
LRVDVRAARARVERALDLGPRRAVTGELLEPLLPVAAKAVAAGELSGEQADVLLETVAELPAGAPPAAVAVVERVLVDAARFETPRRLRRTGVAVLARLDPDGQQPTDDRNERTRGFTLHKRTDGTATPRGRFTAELTALLEAVLDALAAPQPVDGQPDDRSAAQRRHDGLAEALTRVLRSGTLPSAGGAPVTVLATTTIAELTAAATSRATNGIATSGLASLGHGGTVAVSTLLHAACEAAIVPVVFDAAGGIASHGRTERCATPAQRRALAARDGGCAFPGCDRPPAWCEAHHVVEWIRGGRTDLDNLVLLCRHHHRTFTGWGWEVRMTGGVPEWLPPPWLDPHRRPRRNTAHHPPDIDFRLPEEVE